MADSKLSLRLFTCEAYQLEFVFFNPFSAYRKVNSERLQEEVEQKFVKKLLNDSLELPI